MANNGSQNTTEKTQNWETLIALKPGEKSGVFGGTSSSCSTHDTCRDFMLKMR
jgi:hypothetical protein